jgi:hypothetical protein
MTFPPLTRVTVGAKLLISLHVSFGGGAVPA